MANFTPEQLIEKIVEIIEEVDGEGTCIIDPRFTETDAELLRLLKSQKADGQAVGSFLIWNGIAAQEPDSTCNIVTTYDFTLSVLHLYENDSGSVSSYTIFGRRLFNLNEGINAKLDLGLGNLVIHTGLQSITPINEILPWGDASEGEVSHFAKFNLQVEVTNIY